MILTCTTEQGFCSARHEMMLFLDVSSLVYMRNLPCPMHPWACQATWLSAPLQIGRKPWPRQSLASWSLCSQSRQQWEASRRVCRLRHHPQAGIPTLWWPCSDQKGSQGIDATACKQHSLLATSIWRDTTWYDITPHPVSSGMTKSWLYDLQKWVNLGWSKMM